MKDRIRTVLKASVFYGVLGILCAGSVVAQDGEDGINIGGALRYNFFVKDFEDDITAGDVQMTWDTWRLNFSGRQSGFLLDFEYRFYPADQAHFIHHGWMGYNWNDNTQLEVGVTQVPFGDLPYASHSYWFSTAYYLGFEDDYDMGLKLTHTWNNVDLAVAYFLQADPRGVGADVNAGRYSYDLVPTSESSNVERNQVNGRAAYAFEMGEGDNVEVGISGQYGQIYNDQVIDEDDTWRNRYAAAAHVDAGQGPFNLKLHAIYYKFDAVDNEGNTLDEVIMGAYGYTQPVATNATLYTAGLAYELPFQLGPASFTVYNDYTYMDKLDEDLDDAQQNTFGVLVTAGPIYTYVDLASGYNHPWLTNSFGTGLGVNSQPDLQWNHRFNINLGYYF